jgi:hypothetical protein
MKSGKINNVQFGSIFPFESEEQRDQAFNALQPDNNGKQQDFNPKFHIVSRCLFNTNFYRLDYV